MKSHMQRNIIKEILRECHPRKLKPNENFIRFFVQLLLLDPNWGVTENFMNSRSNVQNLVKYVIAELESSDTKILTLKMQFYFTCKLENIDRVPRYNRESVLCRLAPLKAEILNRVYTGTPGFDRLRRNIAIYVTFVSGLGNPGVKVVSNEAYAALRSIMNETEAMAFTKAPEHIKEDQLDYYRRIMCGIRLFNKDSDKGGAGIVNLPNLLSNAIKVVKVEIQATLNRVMETVNLFTLVVDKCYVMKESKGHYMMKCEMPMEVEPNFIETVKSLLLMHRQNEFFVRDIIDLIDKMDEYAKDLNENLETQLEKIHKAVHMRLAVPVDIIFPLFEAVSDLWCALQDQVILLSNYNEIVNNLETYASFVHINIDHLGLIIENIEDAVTCEDDQSSPSEAVGVECPQLVSQNVEVVIFKLNSFANPAQVKLQYLGFCCWKLIETDGGLIPGNTGLGIACYQNKYFAFSSPEACTEFCKKPKEYINHVLDIGRRKPEFIKFLNLMDSLQQVFETNMLVEEEEDIKVMADKEVEFKINCVQFPHIDNKYKWNIWDLKREALVLANLSNCETKSTQTLNNHSTNSMRTQTYLPKTKEVQTKIDNYTSVPTPSSFIFGLRGRRDDKQFSINTTRPTDK